ncbi:hypothetical protein BB560_004167, partial [Smittium megazygosporum]
PSDYKLPCTLKIMHTASHNNDVWSFLPQPLSEYDVSEVSAFIPPEPPLTKFSDPNYSPWECIYASKCGIMAINTDQSISGSIQNKPIPLIDQYTYLGLIFNKKWQSKQTVQNNKNKMEKAMYASFNFLKNPSIPTNIRLMVLKSVLIPIGTYGGKLFGMSEQRCKPIQRVADNALRIIANVGKSAPMHRIRQEMGVTSINTRASDLRERAYFKYPTLRTWISDLVKQPIRSQTSTWVTGTARWMKRYCQTVGRGNTVKALQHRYT